MTDEKTGDQKGLEVPGYKAVQPKAAIDVVARNKHIEELILRDMDALRIGGNGLQVDQRWLATAKTQLEKAFMSYNRAIFQPERVAGDLTVG